MHCGVVLAAAGAPHDHDRVCACLGQCIGQAMPCGNGGKAALRGDSVGDACDRGIDDGIARRGVHEMQPRRADARLRDARRGQQRDLDAAESSTCRQQCCAARDIGAGRQCAFTGADRRERLRCAIADHYSIDRRDRVGIPGQGLPDVNPHHRRQRRRGIGAGIGGEIR